MNRLKWKNEYTVILFIGGIFVNLVIALTNGVLGFMNHSAWQGSLCAYYLFLMVLKLALLFGTTRGDGRIRSLEKWYLYVSIALLVLDLILGGIVYLMATDQGVKHYPGYLIYGFAFYAFCKVITGSVNLIKAHRRRSPILLCMRSIGLVDAFVSILMLEIALIDTFGTLHSDWARTMMASSGAGVWLITAAVAISGIRWYMKRTRLIKNGGYRT